MKVDRDELETRARAHYEALRPEERRELFLFRPAYREHYNRIVQPDQVLHAPPPAYFWNKWFRILKPTCASLYVFIRDIAFANKNKPEDSWCFPDQAQLAEILGISDRATIRKHLNSLEEFGFLKREQEYVPNTLRADGNQLWKKSTCRYLTYYEIPLVPEDAIHLLLLETANSAISGENNHKVGNPPYGPKNPPPHKVGNPPYGEENPPRPPSYPQKGAHKEGFYPGKEDFPASNVNVNRSDLNNVNVQRLSIPPHNRERGDRKSQGLTQISTAVPGVLSPRRSASAAPQDELAREIARTVNGCRGDHGNTDHKSFGFYRLISQRLAPALVQEALRALKDATYESQTGQRPLRNIDGYFAGVVRRICEREGIDLGINWRS